MRVTTPMRRTLLFLLPLTGCTNDQVVEARVDGGTLVLAARPGESNCVGFLRVARGEETLWQIEAAADSGDQRACAAHLPLTYGRLPAGFRQAVAPRPATPGTYAVIGTGTKFLRGAFGFDGRRVVNAAPNSAEWCAIRYPGSHRNWAGSCSIDSANNSH